MKTIMNEQEIRELEQMTGLVETRVNNTTKSSVNNNISGSVKMDGVPVTIKVGDFIVINKGGRTMYGMCDELYDGGRKIGFVTSTISPITWETGYEKPENVRKCKPEEVESAIEGARRYYDMEICNIEYRISQRFACDDRARLKERLEVLKGWQRSLSTAGSTLL